MKILRNIIEIDQELCDGCGNCIPACDEGAIELVNGKARVVAEKYCDGLGACLGECPQGAISVVERMAEDFDPEAVEAYLASKTEPEIPLACGCPSTAAQVLAPEAIPGQIDHVSQLGHWPVQIRLVPAQAPFLADADLLILADCAAVAYAGLHQHLLPGRVVMMGCPKFDDLPFYESHMSEIFSKNQIKSVSVVSMEVPCCSGLIGMVERALEKSGKNLPVKKIVIGLNGKPLNP